MGRRGPAPKPTSLRRLHGDRRDRINDDEPQPAGEIVRPAWLSPRARKVWDALAPNLVERRVLTAWDVDLFAAFCAVVVANRDALRDVEARGATIDGRRNPAWQVSRESATLLVSIGGRFGLTPSDRAQLKVGAAARGPSDDLLTG